MERLREIAGFWNWLPAFRAVGETEHLPTAATGLGIASSSLSRAVGQLERALGVKLFRREEGRLRLDDKGERFLESLRQAMRLVHEAMLDVRQEGLIGRLHIISAGVVTTAHLVPALAELQRDHPKLMAQIESETKDVTQRLLSGRTDLFLSSAAFSHPRLEIELLGTVHSSVYCGTEHPLCGRDPIELDDLASYPFVAPPPDERGTPQDGWPVHLPRMIGMLVDRMRIGCAVCAHAHLLAVLPDPIAMEYGQGAVHRLPIDIIPPAQVYAVRRRPLGGHDRLRPLLELVRSRLHP